MKNKILQFTLITLLLSMIYFTNISFSSGPPTNSSTSGCSCHGPNSANTLVLVNFNNNSSLVYNNNQTYPVTITVYSQSNKPAAGFSLHYNVGSLTPVTAGTLVSSNEWMHTTPKSASGSFPSTTSWTANWTAPATGNIPLEIDAVGNAVSLSAGSANDEWNFASSINIPLPVLFKSITIKSNNNLQKLIWTVGGEVNLEKYVIESSINGKDFKPFNSIKANNKFYDQSYEILLDNVAETTFYRVKAIDLDHSFYFSEVVHLTTQNNAEVSIFPNSTTSNGNVSLKSATILNNHNLIIQNTLGQVVLKMPIQSLEQKIQLPNLQSGIYFVSIQNKTNSFFVDKLIIQ